ncbi:MAG: ankyrin repeat domain-containing protein [Acidobacteria bacterium]|nr:ankyrin repeat domain-containing protein [Acidobacteriota bacterium]
MKQFVISKFYLRFVTCFLTFVFSIAIVFAHKIYINRQGVFNNAAWGGNVKLMKLVTLLGVDVDSSACEYETCPAPIVLAAWYGKDEAVLYLLDKGADVNNKRNWEKTALMMAAFNGNEKTVKLLLSKGADVTIRANISIRDEVKSNENTGETALDWAELRQHTKIIQLLRDAEAK